MAFTRKAPPATWNRTPAEYIAGEAAIAEADKLAHAMEAKWGSGRLRLIVGAELREKFDRQRFLLNSAIYHGDLATLRNEAGRMGKAWMALDRAAEAAGSARTADAVWEVTLANGSVAAIVRDDAAASLVNQEGRAVTVYTLAEIGRFLSVYPDVAEAKRVFPGATVTAVRPLADALDGIRDAVSLSGDMDEIRAMMAAG